MTGRRVRSLIISPSDLQSERIGGIQSFLEGFIKFAPDDFEIEAVGVTAALPEDIGLRRWRTQRVGGRPVRVLPLVRTGDIQRQGRVPLTMRFTAALALHRRLIATAGRVLQFHRPATALPMLSASGNKIQVIHFDLGQVTPGGGENRWQRIPAIFGRIEGRTLRAMDAILAVNDSVAEAYAARYPRLAERIGFLPNWVDDTIFCLASPDQRFHLRDVLLNRLNAARSAKVVVFAGRQEPTKDPGLALAAFAATDPVSADAHLLFVGDGSMREHLENECRARGLADRVHFLGRVPRDELAGIFNASDAMLMTSFSEAGPTSAIEALACGLPVVATPVGRMARLVETGTSGWIAPTHAPEALANGVRWALSQEPSREACAAAARPYSARQVLASFYELHRRLAAAPAA